MIPTAQLRFFEVYGMPPRRRSRCEGVIDIEIQGESRIATVALTATDRLLIQAYDQKLPRNSLYPAIHQLVGPRLHAARDVARELSHELAALLPSDGSIEAHGLYDNGRNIVLYLSFSRSTDSQGLPPYLELRSNAAGDIRPDWWARSPRPARALFSSRATFENALARWKKTYSNARIRDLSTSIAPALIDAHRRLVPIISPDQRIRLDEH